MAFNALATPGGAPHHSDMSPGSDGSSHLVSGAGLTGRVLVVEDDDDTRAALCDALTDLGHAIEAHADGVSALQRIGTAEFDAVLTDIRMPGMDGIELCQRLTGDRPHLPIVVMTAFGDVESALGALRAGAFDFLTKPLSLEKLTGALTRALGRGSKSPIVVRPAPRPALVDDMEGLIGSSAAMRLVAERVTHVAPGDSTVLITGESGTGKELVARAVHRASGRTGPFVAVSCAAIPGDILEAELFGHTRGAFTGASEARQGLLQQAKGGTLFLDEIGELPPDLQPKLLRALQSRQLRPVGSTEEIPFDARIIAATNRDLGRAVAEGKMREDLLYCLNVLTIALPALRDRSGDVLELARHFLGKASGKLGVRYELTAAAERQLSAHSWPGNVRELENAIQASVALASSGQVGFEDLPTGIRSQRPQDASVESRSLEDVERRHILLVLDALHWNKAEAARILGINRATLYRKLQRYGLGGASN
jgi:DNA-binding NtrC family response regulator